MKRPYIILWHVVGKHPTYYCVTFKAQQLYIWEKHNLELLVLAQWAETLH